MRCRGFELRLGNPVQRTTGRKNVFAADAIVTWGNNEVEEARRYLRILDMDGERAAPARSAYRDRDRDAASPAGDEKIRPVWRQRLPQTLESQWTEMTRQPSPGRTQVDRLGFKWPAHGLGESYCLTHDTGLATRQGPDALLQLWHPDAPVRDVGHVGFTLACQKRLLRTGRR